MLGLGCEMVPVTSLVDGLDLPADTLVETLTIQETGGIRATVKEGIARITAMLPVLDARRRAPAPVSELVLGLNCGGSDGYSGITANPALGHASDRLVAAGGTSILAETPEVFGAEHLLTRRAVSEEVGRKLLDRIDWWLDYARAGGGSLDNNPSPGNKAGGLTTILEKSLGAVAKAGQADLADVVRVRRAGRPTRGMVFMDTPGYDPVSVTGIIAGGATVVCFTTGRGSVLGGRPTPVLKLATNTEMYERMSEDMDLDCGRIVDGDGDRPAGRRRDLRADHRRRLRRDHGQRGARPRPGRVHPLAARHRHLGTRPARKQGRPRLRFAATRCRAAVRWADADRRSVP